MSFRLLLSCLATALLGTSLALAQTVVPAGLASTLKERFGNVIIEAVKPSPFPGVFEVYTPTEIAYTDAQGDWLISGNMLNTRTRENVTAASWNDHHRIDYAGLPFDKAIRIVKGDGSRQLAIFEDPLCPFCLELEKTLQSIDDVTVHLFLLPLENLHPGATGLSRDIWCADDPAAAWLTWMHERTAPPQKECGAAPIEEILALSVSLKIDSTPTIVFPDGLRVPGAIKGEALERRLGLQQPDKSGS